MRPSTLSTISTALSNSSSVTVSEEDLDRAVEIVDMVLGRIEAGAPK